MALTASAEPLGGQNSHPGRWQRLFMETFLPGARAEPSTARPSPREVQVGDLGCLPTTNTPVALPKLTEAAR